MINYLQKTWDLIDRFDQKHAKENSTWTLKEKEAILKMADNIDTYGRTNIEHYEKIREKIEKLEYDIEKVDYLDIDTLKDRIHMILDSSRGYNLDDHIASYDGKPLEFFTREEFKKTYFGHGKKNVDYSQWLREKFFYNLLKNVNEEVADGFYTMLHDMIQQRAHGKMVLDDTKDWINFRKFKLITTEQFDNYIQMISKISLKALSEGQETWVVDDMWRKYWNAYVYYLHIYRFRTKDNKWNNGYYLKEGEVEEHTNCNSSNCNVRVKLNNKDLDDLAKCNGLDEKFCENHLVYDEHGKSRNAKNTLHWYTKPLPKAPINIRWVHICKTSWHEGIEDSVLEFIKSNKDAIDLIKIENETFIDSHMDEDRKIKKSTDRVYYIRLKTDAIIKKFQDDFGSTFDSKCSAPEIMRTY